MSQPGSLGEHLRELRLAAGLTGEQLASALHWGSSGNTKISKIETGKQMPTEQEVRDWAAAVGRPDQADNLVDMLAEARSVHVLWRRQVRNRGQAGIQSGIDQRTRAATHIRMADTTVIPGLLQTAGYARSIVTQVTRMYETTDIDAAVQARMTRQDVLYDSSKSFEFLFSETALYAYPCPPQVMRGQLDRLMSLDMENMTIGIIPLAGQLRRMLFNAFMMLDDELIVETLVGKQETRDEPAMRHKEMFAELMAEAAKGEDARRLITAAAERISP